jgi:hypothetical protein
VSTPNIVDRRSEEGPLPYCKIGAKSEGYNRPGHIISIEISESFEVLTVAIKDKSVLTAEIITLPYSTIIHDPRFVLLGFIKHAQRIPISSLTE